MAGEEKIINETSFESTRITKNDIMNLLQAALEKGDPFATEFNERVIIPLTKKIERQIHVSPIEVDGKGLGGHIDSLLKGGVQDAAQEVNITLGKEFELLSRSFGDQIRETARTKGMFELPDFLSPTKRRQKAVQVKVEKLQNLLLDRARKQVRQNLTVKSNLSLKDLIQPQPDESWLTKRKWNKLQRDALKIAQQSLSRTDIEPIKIRDLLVGGSMSKATLRKINKLQQFLISKAMKGASSTSGGFRSITDEEPKIKVSEFTDEAAKQIASITPATEKVSQALKEKKEPGKWVNWLSKIAQAGVAILGGILVADVLGLLKSDGPLSPVRDKIIKYAKTFGKVFGVFLEEKVAPFLAEVIPPVIEAVLDVAKFALVTTFAYEGGFKGTLNLLGKQAARKPLQKGATLLSKNLLKLFGKGTALTTKRIPLIGTLISFGFAGQRLYKGDLAGGIVDIVSGLLMLLPPPIGIPLSIGADMINAWLDLKTGGATPEASKKKFDMLKEFAMPLYEKIKPLLPYIPGIGTIIHVGEAAELFKSGKIVEGTLKFVSAIAVGVPGFGTTVAYGIDILLTKQKKAKITKAKSGQGLTFFENINNFIKDKILTMPIFDVFSGVFKIITGNVVEGLPQFAKGMLPIPIVGPALYAFSNWLTSKVISPSIPPAEKMTFFEAIQDTLKERMISMFKNAPPWMQWLLKRVPALGAILKDEPDIPLDIAPATREQIIAEITDRSRRVEKSRTENAYVGRDKFGREEDQDEILELKKRLKEFDFNKPVDDFVWRAGKKVQPFNAEDNVLSIKSDKVFDSLLKVLTGQETAQKSSKAETISEKLERTELQQTIKSLMNNIQELIIVQKGQQTQQQIAVGPKVTMSGLEPLDGGASRDPAYLLRARVWNNVRTGSALL